MVEGLFFIAGLFLYFLPSMIAAKKRNAAGIITLNLLLGWSVVGWIVSLVWALAAEKLEVSALEAVQLCPACRASVSVGQRFCHSCGTGLTWTSGIQNQLRAPNQSQR